MKAYIFVNNVNYPSNGCIDLTKLGCVLFKTADDAINNEHFRPREHSVLHIEFTEEDQIRNAVCNVSFGNSCKELFSIKILRVITVKYPS